jgi:hypothetical protein
MFARDLGRLLVKPGPTGLPPRSEITQRDLELARAAPASWPSRIRYRVDCTGTGSLSISGKVPSLAAIS